MAKDGDMRGQWRSWKALAGVAVIAVAAAACSADPRGSPPDHTDAGIAEVDLRQPGDLGSTDCACVTADAGNGPRPGEVDADVVSVTLDGAKLGRTFDGIGAISGGGGNARFLIDYPEPIRSQILDYLFKPGYGAALQILKVEIGGDTNSTSGSEPSHMHTSTDLKCDRGWEWWLMTEAKARNPAIKIYALGWAAPGWVGGGNWWTQDMIDYILEWFGCADSNGISIDYVGGRNENGYDKSWYESLHSALRAKGYSTLIVASDDWKNPWGVADDMVTDPKFNAVVDVVGAHYPCAGNSGDCSTAANALMVGKPLWSSENASEDYNGGAFNVAREINMDSIDGQQTAYIAWPIMGAVSPNIVFAQRGLLLASQPWSGSFSLGKQLWAIAHTTQFTKPGWVYVDGASGYLAGDHNNGSFVTLVSPSTGDFSTIIETVFQTIPQLAVFSLSGGLTAPCGLHVWTTNLSGPESTAFVHSADLLPVNGTFSVLLQPGSITTVTTTTGQGRGTATSPPSQSFPLPHQDDFESYLLDHQPRYMADQNGAFEVSMCKGRSGKCLRQAAPTTPIYWYNYTPPYTLIGDPNLTDYTVTTDVMLEGAGSVELIARFSGYGNIGYQFSVNDSGAWSIFKNGDPTSTLAKGSVSSFGIGVWHTLSFRAQGSELTASIDGAIVGTASDGDYYAGQAGLGTGIGSNWWLNAQFDNLSVTP